MSVGDAGDLFGVANGTELSVLELLRAADSRSSRGLLYDRDGNGRIDKSEQRDRSALNDLVSAINETYDRS